MTADTEINRNKMSWLMTVDVMQGILSHRGCLFGNSVRDIYLHDSHAIDFYADPEIQVNNTDINTLYKDKTVLPEFDGRWAIPSNIEAMIHISQKRSFIKFLAGKFTIEYISEDNLVLKEGELKHYQIKLFAFSIPALKTQIYKSLAGSIYDMTAAINKLTNDYLNNLMNLSKSLPSITLDMYVSNVPLEKKQPEPPFNTNIEVLSNALIYDESGIRFTKQLITHFDSIARQQRKLDKTLKNILNYVAIANGQLTANNKLKELVNNGWAISYDYVHFHIVREKYDGHCIICHDQFESTKHHYKMTCCDARFHEDCLQQAYASDKNTECILCKKYMYYMPHDKARLDSVIQIKKSITTEEDVSNYLPMINNYLTMINGDNTLE